MISNRIEKQQELAKAFGEEAFRLAHNLPYDGSGRKVAVHAIIGGIMSQITGAGFASGTIGAGVNEAIIGEIKKIKDPDTAQIVSAIVGVAAAKAVVGMRLPVRFPQRVERKAMLTARDQITKELLL